MVGTYDCVHRDWRDTVTLKADGSYSRGSGDPGKWTFDGSTLVLNWKNWGPEPIQFKARGSFAATDGHFRCTQRGLADAADVPGTYDGAHPDWKDTVNINADGTYKRGSGDPGVWFFDGKTLDLFWINWGQEPVQIKSAGKFASADGRFTITKRGGAVAVAPPPPAPAPAPAPSKVTHSNDVIVGRWAWKWDGDTSIWGPQMVEFRADGTLVDGKAHGTWQLADPARRKYTYQWADGGDGVLILSSNDRGRCKANGGECTAERYNPDPSPEPAPAPAPEQAPVVVAPAPPPPPPAPVVEGNTSRLIKTNKRVYKKGEPVIISYFGMPGGSMDWTNVAKADDATDEWGDWEYASGANGSRTVKNLKPGEYEARVYFNNSTNLEDKVAFTVTP